MAVAQSVIHSIIVQLAPRFNLLPRMLQIPARYLCANLRTEGVLIIQKILLQILLVTAIFMIQKNRSWRKWQTLNSSVERTPLRFTFRKSGFFVAIVNSYFL